MSVRPFSQSIVLPRFSHFHGLARCLGAHANLFPSFLCARAAAQAPQGDTGDTDRGITDYENAHLRKLMRNCVKLKQISPHRTVAAEVSAQTAIDVGGSCV